MKIRLQPLATTELVDAERRRRLAIGIPHGAGRIQVRDGDRSFINLAMTAARLALDAGSKSGDYRWQDPERDFEWILSDNSRAAMDAQTVVEIGQRSLALISSLGITASNLKGRIRGGEQIFDIRNNRFWADRAAD
ncbi:hypothetical protein [Neorhizobium sp. DAR64860/K0K1]|uniref:DUF4376 domain-containing protein n=1 Tax=Neorhizobium sp. DAR64860/K0K1 TaxID=3421955 RepID=UPI003D26E925